MTDVDIQAIVDKAIVQATSSIPQFVNYLNEKLVNVLKNNVRCGVDIIESVNGPTESPYFTDDKFNLYDYNYVRDFLDEYTGNQIMTYGESGPMYVAETYGVYFSGLFVAELFEISDHVFMDETGIDPQGNMSSDESILFVKFVGLYCQLSVFIYQEVFEKFLDQKIFEIFNN